jgi:hypothetical protein
MWSTTSRIVRFQTRRISSPLVDGLGKNGTFNVQPSERGRSRTVLTTEQEVIFLGMICGISETNTSRISAREGVPQNTEGRILNTQILCTHQLRAQRPRSTDQLIVSKRNILQVVSERKRWEPSIFVFNFIYRWARLLKRWIISFRNQRVRADGNLRGTMHTCSSRGFLKMCGLLWVCFRLSRLSGAVYHDLLQIYLLDMLQDTDLQQYATMCLQVTFHAPDFIFS